jgi:phosphatidylinositol alpha-mannosyltransferase
LKIGLVLDDTLDTPDGVQQYVLSIGQWLSKQGIEIHYLVGETKRHDIERIHSLSKNVKVRYNGNRLSIPLPVSKRKLKELLAREKFDVLHVQMPYSPMLAQRIINSAPELAVIVGTFHVLPYSKSTRVGNKALSLSLRRSLKKFDKIFAVTSAAKKFAEKTYRINCDILPNVVDVARFKNAGPLPKYSDDTRTVMFLGRLVPRKGAMALIRAAEVLSNRENLPEFRVVMCGKGPLEAELKQYASDHNLGGLVEFTGFVPEAIKPNMMASADVMVYPSSGGESFGIVLLEAFAAGAAVLAGDNPGYRSVLEPKPELLFDPKNIHELADRIEHFLTDDAARNQISTWEKNYVKQFDVAVVGEQLIKTYRQLLQEKHGVR